MAEPTTEFINVDLHLRSVVSLDVVREALGRSVMVLNSDRIGRKYWLVLELSRSPGSPTKAVRRFVRLGARLKSRAKAAWAASEKEFDIGIQGGFEPDPAEWVVESKAISDAARVGARLRVTVYSPRQLIKTSNNRLLDNQALQRTSHAEREGKPTHRVRAARA